MTSEVVPLSSMGMGIALLAMTLRARQSGLPVFGSRASSEECSTSARGRAFRGRLGVSLRRTRSPPSMTTGRRSVLAVCESPKESRSVPFEHQRRPGERLATEDHQVVVVDGREAAARLARADQARVRRILKHPERASSPPRPLGIGMSAPQSRRAASRLSTNSRWQSMAESWRVSPCCCGQSLPLGNARSW